MSLNANKECQNNFNGASEYILARRFSFASFLSIWTLTTVPKIGYVDWRKPNNLLAYELGVTDEAVRQMLAAGQSDNAAYTAPRRAARSRHRWRSRAPGSPPHNLER